MAAKELKRTLSLTECIFFGVGSILGAGIYTIIGKVAGLAGNLTWLAFMIASFTAFLTAFSYAELSAAYPKAGGEYEYTKNSLGKKMGITLGLVIALNGIISGATVAVGFGGYLTELIGTELLIGSLSIIVLIFIVNVSGIRQSSTINIIFTIIEISGLILVIIAAFPSIGDANLLEMGVSGQSSILMAAALGFFAFIGFEEIVKLAEETNNPKKVIPKALFFSCAIVTLVYFTVAVSVVSALPSEEFASSQSPLSDVAEQGLGVSAALIITIIALFSTSNTILSNMLGSSRVLYQISKETKLLKPLSKISEKKQTPIFALILILFVMAAFSLIGKIEIIALIANIFIFITFFFVNISVVLLRKSAPETERPFKIPLNIDNIPIISILGLLMTLILLGFNIYSLITMGIQE